jgi:hypothetical protein
VLRGHPSPTFLFSWSKAWPADLGRDGAATLERALLRGIVEGVTLCAPAVPACRVECIRITIGGSLVPAGLSIATSLAMQDLMGPG